MNGREERKRRGSWAKIRCIEVGDRTLGKVALMNTARWPNTEVNGTLDIETTTTTTAAAVDTNAWARWWTWLTGLVPGWITAGPSRREELKYPRYTSQFTVYSIQMLS